MSEKKTIRCLIVDDEPPAREIIRRYVEEVPGLQLVGECANAINALSVLQQQPVDLLFLDIRMPQLDGTSFLKTIKNPPLVIFTTAYTEYALEGYDLDIVDYLVKPIRFERFLKAVNKAFPVNGSLPETVAAPVVEKKNESFVYFRADRKMIKVMLSDILYIESMKDYVKIFTLSQGVIVTKQSITSVENMLPANLFVRAHRSFIIAVNRIKSFTSEQVEIENAEIPIGKLYRSGVMKVLS